MLMKIIVVTILTSFLLSFNNKTIGNSTKWINNFKEFRNAVYKKDKAKVKKFINFPVLSSGNQIWYLAYNGNEKALNLLNDKTKPFTEKDFYLYFDKIFSKLFINAILKIKTNELNNKGETESIELNYGKATTYKMIATFEKSTHSLSLNLASNTIEKDTNGEILDGGEFNIIYQFEISSTGQLKLKQVELAG